MSDFIINFRIKFYNKELKNKGGIGSLILTLAYYITQVD
jgi:hypothetical protein